MQPVAPAEKDDDCDEGCLSGMVRAIGRADGDNEAEKRLQQLHELSRFVHAKVGTQGHFVLGGDFNMIGGSADYLEAAKLFGRQSANAPTFAPTYTTRSFLTPPGWKNIAWESNLDHMFTNLDVCDFQVKSTVDISDHLPMHLTVSQPRTSDDIITHELIEDMTTVTIRDYLGAGQRHGLVRAPSCCIRGLAQRSPGVCLSKSSSRPNNSIAIM